MKILHGSMMALAGLWLSQPAIAKPETPSVLVTVRPIHSLVAAVMDGIGEPVLLLKGGQTPHSYSLNPSGAKAINDADIVVWVGEPLEMFLEGPLETLAADAEVIELAVEKHVTLLPNREGGVWLVEEDHDHENKHDDDAHEDHADDNHDHSHYDGHIWMDPNNARGVIRVVADALSITDSENAAIYLQNAEEALLKIDGMETELRDTLSSVQEMPFLVSHDALQYFDKYFDLNAVGAFTTTPDRALSARRLSEIRQRVKEIGSLCLFSEPGFSPKTMGVVAEAADVSTGVVDPLGMEYEPGKTLYFALMRGLAAELARCLGQQGPR
ncbi:MAG: zinc ABC transporter substrate-binding protein [Rhodospirillaceae bacterium]|nr:zinc ABC transporter substrate-binding protein [Rhodospirillaceae bacterium]